MKKVPTITKMEPGRPFAPPAPSLPSHLSVARKVLEIEEKALSLLAKSLDDSFSQAVEILHRCRGRLMVTGMGKSGHIARKLAASFSSTGTPSCFLHPAEASHGDLGAISPQQDVILALSNSGETRELADIVAYAQHHGNPLIAITQQAHSTLAQASTTTLVLPPTEEACPNGLAPTTSTTVMLALGDALMVALLSRKNFTKESFRALHPGGSLGSRLKKVSSIMHNASSLPLVKEDTPMTQALLTMTSYKFGCVGVLGPSGRLVGIITDGDIRRHMSSELLEKKASEIMTTSPQTISPHCLAEEALQRMKGKITLLFVTEDEKPLGIIHIHDLLKEGLG